VLEKVLLSFTVRTRDFFWRITHWTRFSSALWHLVPFSLSSSYTAVVQTECQAKTMDEKLQEAKAAAASMEDDASTTAIALAEEFSDANAITMGYAVAVVLFLLAMIM